VAQVRAWRGQPWLCPRFPSLTVVGGPLWRTLQGHTHEVLAVAIADGRVISGSRDHSVRVWDLASGACQHVLQGHTGAVLAVTGADGRVISGSSDHSVR